MEKVNKVKYKYLTEEKLKYHLMQIFYPELSDEEIKRRLKESNE